MGLSAGTFIIIDQIFALIEIGFRAQELKDKLTAMKTEGKSEAEITVALDQMLDKAEMDTQAAINTARRDRLKREGSLPDAGTDNPHTVGSVEDNAGN